jgi:hypothetical protein
MEFQKRAGGGKIPYLNFIELFGKRSPLAFMHGYAAEHEVAGTARHKSTVARLVDVENVHKKGG